MRQMEIQHAAGVHPVPTGRLAWLFFFLIHAARVKAVSCVSRAAQ